MRPRSRQALVALSIAGLASTACVVLVFILASRDTAPVVGPSGPGERPRPGDPPVSGAHRRAPVTADGVALSRDQVLTALAAGDVVIFSAAPSAALRRLQRDVSGPFSADLAAAGQAVILVRRPGAGIVAAAWGRVLHATRPDDPRVKEFADAWLGRGNVG